MLQMSNLRLNKIKSQTPISVIIHGGNRIGYLTAKTLIEQGSYVVIIDKFTGKTKKYLTELKKSELFDFFDFRGLPSLLKTLKRFDYLFYFLNEKLQQQDEFDSKEFLNETKILEDTLINARKHNAKFSLITSLQLNRDLANIVNNTKLATPSPYSNIELQKYCETLTAEFKDKSNINLRILRLGTVIGKGISNISCKPLDDLFRDAVDKPQITIKGEGLDIYSLIHESDATYGLLKLAFSDNTRGEVISLANKNNYTTLSLAYKLLELNTEAQAIRFVENPDSQFLIQDLYVPAPHASKYGWTQQISLENALIEQVQSYYDSVNKQWNLDSSPKKKVKKDVVTEGKTKLGQFLYGVFNPIKGVVGTKRERKSINYKKGFLLLLSSLGILSFIYFVLYPIMGTVIGTVLISNTAKDLSLSVFDLNNTKATSSIEKIERNITRVSDSIENLYWLFYITGKQELYDNTSRLVLATQYTAEGASSFINATYPLARYVQDFEPALDFQTSTSSTTREYREYLLEIEKNAYKLDDASYKISLATELIKSLNTSVFPKTLQQKILEIKDITYQLEEGVNATSQITSFLPDLLGTNERKRYLILFQNEGEIRSTGGWLTSYGIIGIEGGQIRELFVDDVYNADGTLRVQNKKHTPPASMTKALELTNWPFSLVNWYPDLSDTMSEAEPFIDDLGKGNKLDGLITINVSFIQKLLSKWDGIEVPGETEIITSSNLYDKIFQMHEDFVPGSTQKTTFLANLANEIIQKLLAMNIPELMDMGNLFQESLDEKHIQATFRNTDAFAFFHDKRWANSLDFRYNNTPIDIDWNWGGNKANLYLDKNYNLTIDIKDSDTIDLLYTITVANNSSSEIYPEGEYKNYQRVYIPTEATVLRINGINDNEYTIFREGGFKVIGGWFNIPIKSTNTLELAYRLKREGSMSNFPLLIQEQNAFLDLNIFKQPGERKHAYKIELTYPSTWDLENSGNLNSISNQLTGTFELNQDLLFSVVWKVPN